MNIKKKKKKRIDGGIIMGTGVFKMPPKRLLSHYKLDAQRNRLLIMSCNAEDMLLPTSHFTFYGNLLFLISLLLLISLLFFIHFQFNLY